MTPVDRRVAQAEPLLAVRDLSVEFRLGEGQTFSAVRGISFDIASESTVALVGESGSGKSVSALAIMGLLPRETARIGAGSSASYRERDLLTLPGRALRKLRGAEISMIFQEPMSSLNPVFSVGFQLQEVLSEHLGLSRRQARSRAIELLGEVGIPDPGTRVDAFPFQLSGGQQQRVMIAMAIACEPRLLIADEPTTSLDVTVQKQIMQLLAELKARKRMSMLFISHDLALVGEIADRIIVMRNGTIREQGPAVQILGEPRDSYTKALLRCRPSVDTRRARLPVIDDFLQPAGAQPAVPERPRGLRGDEAIVLDVRNLTKRFSFREGFGKREFTAVDGASFALAKGKTVGLVGESGSGKTTLARMVAGLIVPTHGQMLFDGADLLSLRPQQVLAYKRRLQIVFQNPYASLNPRFTAAQILLEPMQIHSIGADERERYELAAQLLEKVGLPASSLSKYPHEFSGGQRQRIAVARCLTLRPDVLICDESVSALDVSVQAQLLNLLQDLQDEYGMSYLFISHDLAVVRYMADQVLVMRRGEIVEAADSSEIYSNPRHPYTKELLSAMPRARPLASA